MSSVVIGIASAFSALLFLACAWLTRAGYWRTAAALLGGLIAGAARFGLDVLAYRFDWWTQGEEAYAPVVTYAPVVFWFGAGLGLIGWRMMRNWGGVGEWLFFIVFVALGLTRDLVLAIGTGALVFGDGYLPYAIAAAGWLAMAILVQTVMQILVGPVDADHLAPERIPQLEEDSRGAWVPLGQADRDPFGDQAWRP